MIPGIRARSYALRQCWSSDDQDDGAYVDANDADKDDADKDYAENDYADKDYADKNDLRNTSERLFSVLVAFSLAGLVDLVRSCTCFEYFSFLIFFLFLLYITLLFKSWWGSRSIHIKIVWGPWSLYNQKVSSSSSSSVYPDR